MVKYICFPGIFKVTQIASYATCDGNRQNAKALAFAIANTPQSYPFCFC